MPLFGSKFSPKRAPARKASASFNNDNNVDFYNENRVITLKLTDHECYFENGKWVPVNGESGESHANMQKLFNKINTLEEENNMLRIKFDIILNMLTELSSENHVQGKELQKSETTYRMSNNKQLI